MTKLRLAQWILLASLVPPAFASDFVVLSASGVVEPEGLQREQELTTGTLVRLEPWGRLVVREAAGCGFAQVIVGAAEHTLQPAQDCSTVGAPQDVMELVQQGRAFAAPLNVAGSEEAMAAVQALLANPCVFLTRVSDEGGNARRCPSGYALRGLRCTGEHCDNKDLLCCPYLDGKPDPKAKELTARLISEEFPNISRSKGFLIGLACNGPFCDNIMPFPIKTSSVKNGGQCDWTPWSSEVPGQWLDCGEGRLISGIRCGEDYCGDVSVYCCQPKAP